MRRKPTPILFVTGTDTGVGKTVATACLLYHLRQQGINALAIKPFCTGDRSDVHLLQAFQPGILSDDQVNPFFFRLPLAPWVAAKKERRTICLDQAVAQIHQVTPRCDFLLVEGCGGLLVPLGENFTFLDLINNFPGNVLIVAPNKLGVINHALLTDAAITGNYPKWPVQKVEKTGNKSKKSASPVERTVILCVGQETNDNSSASNLATLSRLTSNTVLSLPFLGSNPLSPSNLQKKYKNVQKILARIVG